MCILYFVFEYTTWLVIQVLLEQLNIRISGGSISRRQFLSTSEFKLSLFLSKLGYSLKDIYSSIDFKKKYLQVNLG